MFDWTTFRAALNVQSPLIDAINRVLARMPLSHEPAPTDPKGRSQVIGRIASVKAAAISGSLALPPGPAGLLTIVPDLYLIWRLQGQMVADIASVYGKTAYLTREGMAYCLFKHGAAQVLREFVVRSGQRLLVRRASMEAASRWVPLLGSVGVGAFAWRDTAQVARTAVEVFESDLSIDEPPRQIAS